MRNKSQHVFSPGGDQHAVRPPIANDLQGHSSYKKEGDPTTLYSQAWPAGNNPHMELLMCTRILICSDD